MMETAKIQPHATDLEERVLGLLLSEPGTYLEVAEVLTPDCFYKEDHATIFSAVVTLSQKSIPIDVATVANELKRMGKLEDVGNHYHLSVLTNKASSSPHLASYAGIIKEKYLLRALIEQSSKVIRSCYEADADAIDVIAFQESFMQEINQSFQKNKKGLGFNELLKLVLTTAEQAAKDGGVTGVPSKIRLLNHMTAGYQATDLIILAARPGMGKSNFAAEEGIYAAKQGFKTLIISQEMSSLQIVQRMVAADSEIELERIRKGNFSEDGFKLLNSGIAKLWGLPISIDDSPSLAISELRRKCLRHKSEKGLDFLIIDYLQLMQGDDPRKSRTNREQEVSYISRSLKALAKEMSIPVLALAQLSRDTERRGGFKVPQLSDLRDSGAIEQDADQVMFLFRPEYYGITEFDDGSSTAGCAELHIAKNRNGKLGKVPMKFLGEYTKFENENYTSNAPF